MRTTNEAKEQFGLTITWLRAQATVPDSWPDEFRRGQPCQSWPEFVAAAKEQTRMEVSRHPFEKYAQPNQWKQQPPMEILAVFHMWGIFTFKNGDPVTADRLIDILMGFRDWQGNLITKPANGEPSTR